MNPSSAPPIVNDLPRRRSRERGNISRSHNDIEERNEVTKRDQRQPLMSQKEAFQRQLSKRSSDGKNFTPHRDSNAFHSQERHYQNEITAKHSRRDSSEIQSFNPTTHRSVHKSFHPELGNEQPSTSKKSSKSRYTPPRSPQRFEGEKSKSSKSSKHNKAPNSSGDTFETNDNKGGRNERNDRYSEKEVWRQKENKRDSERDHADRLKNDYGKGVKTTSKDLNKLKKRSNSNNNDDYCQVIKKSKNQSEDQGRADKSSRISENDKGYNHEDIKENNISRDSDIDSASSETKRVSALSRLGPKLSLNERLSSKLPETTGAFMQDSTHDVGPMNIDDQINGQLNMKNTTMHHQNERYFLLAD